MQLENRKTEDGLGPKSDQLADAIDALVDDLKKRDPFVFAQFLSLIKPVFMSVINHVTHSWHDSEEVFMEGAMNVWNSMDRFDPAKGNFLRWAITIFRRAAIDRLRSTNFRNQKHDKYSSYVFDELRPSLQQKPDDVIKAVDIRATKERLLDLLHSDAIPPLQRECLISHWLEGKSERQLASEKHLSLGTIKTRLKYGLSKLTRLVRCDSSLKHLSLDQYAA
jgi:RNA polymerase sigma-70 factor, ECF subfamily